MNALNSFLLPLLPFLLLLSLLLPIASTCPAGSHITSPGPTTSCSLCPVVAYQPTPNQITCLNCGVVLYNPATGASSAEACVQCEPGK